MSVKSVLSLLLILFISSAMAENRQRTSVLLNGNKITVQMWNYGSFSSPGNRSTDFVWNGLGYANEVGFFVGAEVEAPQGSHPDVFQDVNSGRWLAHIISDGIKSSGGEVSSDGQTRWGWQPVVSRNNATLEYFELSHPDINGNGIPDGWPESWWNADEERYSWPGLWGWGEETANYETLYGMDDRDNPEFEYYPFENDSTRKGLGLQMEVRSFQMSDFYEDVIFVTFDLTNISDNNLDKMLFGLWGDPHIGGADDWRDDWQAYDSDRQMLYAWDDDGKSVTNPNITPGYFGISFLQTPGNAGDGVDNDNDGMTDESQNDGIDNDGDWSAVTDDVGADGIAGTSDTGEGDGIPTLGEPAFEYKDMDEADMLGITSFKAPPFSAITIKEDEKIWQYLSPGNFDSLTTAGDFVLMGGSAYFSLEKGETKRVGIAFVMGQDLTDLQGNADYAKAFYHDNLGSASNTADISVMEPQNGTSLDNPVTIQWDASSLPADAELFFSYRAGFNQGWIGVTGIPNSGSYSWNTEGLSNSAFYKIRLRSVSPVTNVKGESSGYFTIKHAQSGNTPPEIYFDFPEGKTVKDDFNVTWLAGDADGDALSLHLIVSSPTVQDTISVTGNSYLLPTKRYPNGLCTLELYAHDGTVNAKTEHSLQINNEYQELPSGSLLHQNGGATGEIITHIVEEEQLIKNTYFISFDDTSSAHISYSVFDSLNQIYLISGDVLPEFPENGRLFDGMRLSFVNSRFQLNTDETGWQAASSTNMEFTIIRESNYAEDPYDYEIRFYDQIVDTTVNNIEVNYRVRDLLNNVQMETAVSGANSQWKPTDTIFILRGGKTTNDIVWKMDSAFPGGETQKNPGDGDIYYIKTFKPFSVHDRYSLNTSSVGINSESALIPEQMELQQNYPNPFNNTTTIIFTVPQAIQAELVIYDVAGQKIKTLFSGKTVSGNNRYRWNGKTEQGKEAASGLYFYRLKTNRGSIVKKLILIK